MMRPGTPPPRNSYVLSKEKFFVLLIFVSTLIIPNVGYSINCPCGWDDESNYDGWGILTDDINLNTFKIFLGYNPPAGCNALDPGVIDYQGLYNYAQVIKAASKYLQQNYANTNPPTDLNDVLSPRTSPGYTMPSQITLYMDGGSAGASSGNSLCVSGAYQEIVVDPQTIVHELTHIAQGNTAPLGFPDFTVLEAGPTFNGNNTGTILSGVPTRTAKQSFDFINLGMGWDLIWYGGVHYYTFLFDFWASQNINSKRLYEVNAGWNRNNYTIQYTDIYNPNNMYSYTPLPGFIGIRAFISRLQANQCGNVVMWPSFDSGQTTVKCVTQSMLDVIDTNSFNDWNWSSGWGYPYGFVRSWLAYADFNWWGDVTEGTPAYTHDWYNHDLSLPKSKTITKYHPIGRTREEGPEGFWFSEGFQNYQTGPITIIIRAKCDYNDGINSDNLSVYIDGAFIGTITGAASMGRYRSYFLQTNLTSIGWHSLEFRGTHTPTIQQVVVGVGSLDLVASYRPTTGWFDCYQGGNPGECIYPLNTPTTVSLNAGDYIVETQGIVYHRAFNNETNRGWEDSILWAELDGDKGFPQLDTGISSLYGGVDNSRSGLVTSSTYTQYSTYNRGTSRRIVTIPSSGVKTFYVKAKIKGFVDEVIVYPKPEAELFNMYFTTQSPLEIFYLHPITRNVMWDNWINIQGIETGGPGDVYAEYTTATGYDRYNNLSWKYYGPYNNPLVLKNRDYSGNTNYVFIVSAPDYRKNYKIIFN